MYKDITNRDKIGSERSLLCFFIEKIKKQKILEPLYNLVRIAQKTVKHKPVDKLIDLLLSMLCGDEAVYQMNTTVKTDRALQKSAGLSAFADQSSVQRTLEA